MNLPDSHQRATCSSCFNWLQLDEPMALISSTPLWLEEWKAKRGCRMRVADRFCGIDVCRL